MFSFSPKMRLILAGLFVLLLHLSLLPRAHNLEFGARRKLSHTYVPPPSDVAKTQEQNREERKGMCALFRSSRIALLPIVI